MNRISPLRRNKCQSILGRGNRYYHSKEEFISLVSEFYATPPTNSYLQQKLAKVFIFRCKVIKRSIFSQVTFLPTTKLLRHLEFLLHIARVGGSGPMYRESMRLDF